MTFKNLLPKTVDVDQKYISFLMKNDIEVYNLPIKYIQDYSCRTIATCIKEIKDKNLKLEFDILFQYCKQKGLEIEYSYLETVDKSFIDFSNIDDLKTTLKNNYYQAQIVGELENIMVAACSSTFNPNKVKEKLDYLNNCLYELEENTLLTAGQMVENYLGTMDKRKKGESKKSLSFSTLEKIIRKPGHPEEMTAIVAQKGGGKSIFAKCIELGLINKKTCVLSINLEMPEDSCMDRLTCLRTGITIEELLRQDKNPRMEAKIIKEIEEFKTYTNYLAYMLPTLSLNQLDGLIYQAKQIFRKNGVLPEDEYIFVVIDLIDMIEEFSDSQGPYNIKKAVNKLHQINKKHKSHFLILLQANESKFRTGKMFKKSEELDFYKVGLEDIEGAAAYAARCRCVITLTRPLDMKKRFFPEEAERWELETDIINCNIVKQNDGPTGFCRFIFGNNFKIYPYAKTEEEFISTNNKVEED